MWRWTTWWDGSTSVNRWWTTSTRPATENRQNICWHNRSEWSWNIWENRDSSFEFWTRDYSEHEIFLNTNYIFWTRIKRITRIFFEHIFFEHELYFWTRITRITRIFFDWKYCEAIKDSCYSCSNILFVFKENRIFRVQMTWLWCLLYRKARNAQKRISGKSGCCIFVASIRHNVVH